MSDLKISELNRNWEYVNDWNSLSDIIENGSYWNLNSYALFTYLNKTYVINDSGDGLNISFNHKSQEIKNHSVWNDGTDFYAISNQPESNNNYIVYKFNINGSWNRFFTTNIAIEDCEHNVWRAGGKTYYTASSQTYEFDKSTPQWKTSTIQNASIIDSGQYIWHDSSGNAYYSKGSTQYKFDISQNKWVSVTWNISNITAKNIWYFKGNIYYSNDSNQYEFDETQNQWKIKQWTHIGDDSWDIESFVGDGNNLKECRFIIFENGDFSYNFIDSYRWNPSSYVDNRYISHKLYRAKIVTIGDDVVQPPLKYGASWKIGSSTGPDYRYYGLHWGNSNGSLCGCGEYKESDTAIADSGYLYLSDNSKRIPYTTNKNIKFAHLDDVSGSLVTPDAFYPLWTTGQIDNREIVTNKTRYIIFNGNKRYIADSPTATSGTNLSYTAVKYKDGSGGELSERHWKSTSGSGMYATDVNYEVYVMNNTYLTYEYRKSGKSIPNAYNLASMTFTVNKASGVVSASYTNPVLYSIDYTKTGASPSHTYGKYNNFTLSSDGTLVLNFYTDLTSGTWYVKKIVIQVYETTTKYKW